MFKGMSRYFKQYKLKNITAMLKNNKADPAICNTSFKGKFTVITGATSGIGLAAAHKYAAMGSDLLCVNRNREKSEILCRDIESKYPVKCDYLLTDFSDLAQVRPLVNKLQKQKRPIDILIHNAGVYMTRRMETAEGLETVFVVNHLSSFLMNSMLMDHFKKQKKGRIILVNSEGHRFAPWGLRTDDLNWEKRRYSGLGAYGQAKLAQLLTMLVFAEQLEGSGVTINAMHPGAVKSNSGKDNGRLYKWYKDKIIERNLRPVDISAESLYYLGAAEEPGSINGRFFNLTALEDPAPPAVDRLAAQEIYELSLRMVGLDQ